MICDSCLVSNACRRFAAETIHAPKEAHRMNIALWIVQTLLALVFLAAGGTKVSRPKDALAKDLGGALPLPLVRFIGAAEILGAIALIAPHATRTAPRFTPIAARRL